MQNLQDVHTFDCFDLSSRLALGSDNEDWIAFSYVLTCSMDSKPHSKGSDSLNKLILSQDDCINKSLHPKLFSELLGNRKTARRAAYNFHVGLSNVMDACRQKKSANCWPTPATHIECGSDIVYAEEDHDDDMWYFCR